MPMPIRSTPPKAISTPVSAVPTFVELPMEREAVGRLFNLAAQGAVLQGVPDWGPQLPANQKFQRVPFRSIAGTSLAVMLPIGPNADPDKVFLERRINDPLKPGQQFIAYRGPVSLAVSEARQAKSSFDGQQAAKNLDSVRAPLAQVTQALGAAIGALPLAQAATARQALGELQAASTALGPLVTPAGWGPKAAAPSGLAAIAKALELAKADLSAQLAKAPAGTPLSTGIASALASLERARAKLAA